METIQLNIDKALGSVTKEQVFAYEKEVAESMEKLHKGTGKGNDFLGWLHLPSSITGAHLSEIEAAAKQLRERCEIVVVIGIGGSYLGAKAVIEALSDTFAQIKGNGNNPQVLFAGQNIGEDYLYELQQVLAGKQFGLINISKSGTTTRSKTSYYCCD